MLRAAVITLLLAEVAQSLTTLPPWRPAVVVRVSAGRSQCVMAEASGEPPVEAPVGEARQKASPLEATRDEQDQRLGTKRSIEIGVLVTWVVFCTPRNLTLHPYTLACAQNRCSRSEIVPADALAQFGIIDIPIADTLAR